MVTDSDHIGQWILLALWVVALLCVLALMVTAPRSPDLVHSGSTSTPVIYQGSPTP